MNSDVREAVFCGGKSAGPRIRDFQLHLGKEPSKFLQERPGLLRNQCVPALRVHEVFVFAADDDTSFGGGPQIKVRRPLSQMRHWLLPS